MFESVEKKSGKRNVLMGYRKMYTQGREEAIKRVGVVVSSGEKKPLAPTPLQKDGDRNEISPVARASTQPISPNSTNGVKINPTTGILMN